MKLRNTMRFLGAAGASLALLLLVFLRVTSCAPVRQQAGLEKASPSASGARDPAGCRAPEWTAAANANGASLQTLAWAPFGRQELGWEIYVPLIQQEIRTGCAPETEGFAAALARWQAEQSIPADGRVSDTMFGALKGVVQSRRDFVRFTSFAGCPDSPDEIQAARLEEGYSGKAVQLRPAALEAYRRMVAAARRDLPEIEQDPRWLTIFSGYRSPAADAARCAAEGNCDGVVRARCSAHRTGLAMDIYVGQAPGFGPDSSADPNRLAMTRTPVYRWLLANAGRFGFVNYPFEPWHWEWTGEQP